MSNLSRRKFIITAGATAAGTLLVHGCSSNGSNVDNSSSTGGTTPSVAPVANGSKLETTKAKLGFIALTDSAPLIIAYEKGLFKKYGMTDVEVVKQTSWAATRDNLELGSEGGGIDGAHILSPMPYLMTAGAITKTKQPLPMYILARLNTNGQGISVSNKYKELNLGKDSSPLKQLITGGKKLTCAVTFPGGTHDLWMRSWLSAGGIDPEKDVEIIVIPPPQMVASMKSGKMDAFCVGEPWNGKLVQEQIGYTALVTGEMWKDHPEKALSMRSDWVDKNPQAATAILMAVQEAQIWCDQAENKDEMSKIISTGKYLKVDATAISDRSKGKIDYGTGRIEAASPVAMKFWENNTSFPYKSHDAWFIAENIRWGQLPADTDIKKLVDKVNREDLWKEAAKAINQTAAIPTSDSRGVEDILGVKFDPADTDAYLKSLTIKKA
ncbi:CmpA/NrtA family ABC transporter substrate-binding protein [Calothrix sp. PCC 6303]|uniref:CmpA/NrtA family ABC transporter substrate-binding protein n=1 Tax=Calothrix sp. PCC 6303 TaxID=1170562 RepID=UPI0002A05099|nr:CmpA/NrtA family ABC transporter substrate-binding protein [Calothrix sp. PCC 6303]AFZ00090.1 nitrate transport protein [Calothrix sp. PCC 6303]